MLMSDLYIIFAMGLLMGQTKRKLTLQFCLKDC